MDQNLQIIVALALVLLTVLITLAKLTSSSKRSAKLPPGPRPLPLFGNLHNLVGGLPHHRFRELAQKYGPLIHLKLGEVSTIVASSPEMAREVLKTHDSVFAYRPAMAAVKAITYDHNDIGFSPYGSYWRQLRKICATELLSANCVRSYRSIREEEVANMVASIHSVHGQLPVNLTQKIFSLTFGITARAAFGKKCKDQEEFIKQVTKLSWLAGGFSVADLYPSLTMMHRIDGSSDEMEKVHKEMDRILQEIVREHREERKSGTKTEGEAEDLVDVLLRLQEQGEFPADDSNVKAVILDVFAGGSETSSSTVEWAMSEILRNPRVMREAQAEVRRVCAGKGTVDEEAIGQMSYLKVLVKETMRLHPSLPLLVPRECSQTCEVGGYTIPAKSRIIVNAWAIGRDPKNWDKAEDFLPERFIDGQYDFIGRNMEYIPFGGGRRICPGILFALPNVELPLAQLLFHFDWKLPNGAKGEDLEMSEKFGLDVKRMNDLMVIATPYRPL